MLGASSGPSRRWFAKHASRGRLVGVLMIGAWLLPSVVCGAEIRGRVVFASTGRAVVNQPIRLRDRVIGRTDSTGTYALDLPPGRHVVTILDDNNVILFVSPHGNRQDIRVQDRRVK